MNAHEFLIEAWSVAMGYRDFVVYEIRDTSCKVYLLWWWQR